MNPILMTQGSPVTAPPSPVVCLNDDQMIEALETLASRRHLAWPTESEVEVKRAKRPIYRKAPAIQLAPDSPEWLHPLVFAAVYVSTHHCDGMFVRIALLRALHTYDAEQLDSVYRLGGAEAIGKLVVMPAHLDDEAPRRSRKAKP